MVCIAYSLFPEVRVVNTPPHFCYPSMWTYQVIERMCQFLLQIFVNYKECDEKNKRHHPIHLTGISAFFETRLQVLHPIEHRISKCMKM